MQRHEIITRALLKAKGRHVPEFFGLGEPNAELGWFFLPEVQGGEGKANDIFGSVYGWSISKDAPKETLEFMEVLLGRDIQTKLAAEGLG